MCEHIAGAHVYLVTFVMYFVYVPGGGGDKCNHNAEMLRVYTASASLHAGTLFKPQILAELRRALI